jgi:hypothetical protein
MKINQSLIKRMEGDYCPKKLKAEMDGVFRRTPSEAMIKGQYFEWMIFQTKNREGEIPVLPLLKNGNKSTDQIRIEKQAINFHKVLKQEEIKIFGTDRTFEAEMFGVKTFGTWDAYGLRKGKPLIIDVKSTGNVESTFGDFSWGDFPSMDKLQAKKYMLAGRQIDGVPYDFLYMVFDFSPQMNHRLYTVHYVDFYELEVKTRTQETVGRIEHHERKGWYAKGSGDECADCCFSGMCESFVDKKEAKAKNKTAKLKTKEYKEDLVKAQQEVDDILKGVFS